MFWTNKTSESLFMWTFRNRWCSTVVDVSHKKAKHWNTIDFDLSRVSKAETRISKLLYMGKKRNYKNMWKSFLFLI